MHGQKFNLLYRDWIADKLAKTTGENTIFEPSVGDAATLQHRFVPSGSRRLPCPGQGIRAIFQGT